MLHIYWFDAMKTITLTAMLMVGTCGVPLAEDQLHNIGSPFVDQDAKPMAVAEIAPPMRPDLKQVWSARIGRFYGKLTKAAEGADRDTVEALFIQDIPHRDAGVERLVAGFSERQESPLQGSFKVIDLLPQHSSEVWIGRLRLRRLTVHKASVVCMVQLEDGILFLPLSLSADELYVVPSGIGTPEG